MKCIKRMIASLVSICMAAALIPAGSLADESASKDQTVFIMLNPDGSVQSQTVSVWMHADGGLDAVKDRSTLDDIKNIKTGETPMLSGKTLSWSDSTASDVYYQGTTSVTPPITAKISYTLNGAAIDPAALVGKSGHLSMTVALKNGARTNVTIDGKNHSLYTPYACLVGTDLDVESFKSVSASHGTVESDSTNQLVGFVMLPGMRENFEGLFTGKFDSLNNSLLDTVTIETDVDHLDALPTFFIACASDLDLLDTDTDFGDFTSLTDDLDELKDAMTKLIDGCEDLKDGSGKLGDGADALNEGAEKLDAGAGKLQTGVAVLDSGADELSKGLATLASNNTMLNGSLDQILNGVVSTVNQSLEAELVSSAENTAATKLSSLLGGSFTLTLSNYSSVIAGKQQRLLGAYSAGQLDAVTYQALNGMFAKTKLEMDKLKELYDSIQETQSLLSAYMLEAQEPSPEEAPIAETPVSPETPMPELPSAEVSGAETPVSNDAADAASNESTATPANSTLPADTATADQPADTNASEQPVKTSPTAEADTAPKSEAPKAEAPEAPEAEPSTEAEAAMCYSMDTGCFTVDRLVLTPNDLSIARLDSVAPTASEQQELVNEMAACVSDALNSLLSLTFKNQADGEIQHGISGLKSAGALPLTLADYDAQITAISGALGVPASSFDSVKETLKGLRDFKAGLSDYTAGVLEAQSGAGKLVAGIEASLVPGTSELKQGTAALVDGTKTLKNGTQDLVDGVDELTDGVHKLNDEGISKLTDSEEINNLSSIVDILDALKGLSASADAYGVPEGVESTVNYVMKTV